MLISEIFYSLQGEGPIAGRPSSFIRTAGCDYRCAWCDTKYAVWPENRRQWKSYTIKEVWEQVQTLQPKSGLVTLTGGNPTLQKDVPALLDIGIAAGYQFALETQASVWRPWFRELRHLILSPKPPSSGNETSPLNVAACLAQGARWPSLKFVIANETDYRYAKVIADKFPGVPVYLQPVHLAPEAEEIWRDRWFRLVERVLRDHWDVCVLPQLHLLLWQGKAGK